MCRIIKYLSEINTSCSYIYIEIEKTVNCQNYVC